MARKEWGPSIVVLLCALLIALLIVLAGSCRAVEKAASTVEVGYTWHDALEGTSHRTRPGGGSGASGGEWAAEESWSAWVSFKPLVALESHEPTLRERMLERWEELQLAGALGVHPQDPEGMDLPVASDPGGIRWGRLSISGAALAAIAGAATLWIRSRRSSNGSETGV